MSEARWIDAHTHLDFPAFDADRDAVLARASQAGVRRVVVCGADPSDWDRVERVAAAYGAWWTLGVHPWWVAELHDDALDRAVDRLRARPTPHGLGETGLDYRTRDAAVRARQLRSFQAHLELAMQRDVPVVLHVVRAYPDALRAVERVGLPPAGGMVHSWSGDARDVRRALRLGLCVSFSASVLRSDRVLAACAEVPLDRLLLETDAPDQPLVPGTRGEPADVVPLAHQLGARLGVDPVELLEASAKNASRLFSRRGEPEG